MRLNELLTIGCGGEAEVLTITDCRHMEYKEGDFVLGMGSNVLACEGRISQRVILIRDKSLQIFGDKIYAGAGVALPHLSAIAVKEGLSGLEWATGIPGSVGGAVKMNAGAFGHEISEITESVDIFDGKEHKRLSSRNIKFGYRTTCGIFGVITGVTFKLKRADRAEVAKLTQSIIQERKALQPSGKSFGSVFKKAGDKSAGWYIDRAGLKGYRIGGAMISDKHANFIINDGQADANDIRKLIDFAKLSVYRKFNVKLEEEVVYLGEF